jgi:hypothetical protein
MVEVELDIALEWAAVEGWNPGLGDGACFRAADADGFLIGLLDGHPIGCISVVRYGVDFGFLGFYIVRRDWRGRGFGLQLWEAGLQHLQGRTIGLDGVVAQQDNYRRSGFTFAHRNVRFGGQSRTEREHDPRVRAVDPQLVSSLLEFDRRFFPADRERFLRCWLRDDRRQARAFVEDGRVCGYGVIRPCRDGFKVGPLFALTEEAADLLFAELASTAKGETVYLDCPEPNGRATELARRNGLTAVFETARMYRGAAPDLPLGAIYGITTFELG